MAFFADQDERERIMGSRWVIIIIQSDTYDVIIGIFWIGYKVCNVTDFSYPGRIKGKKKKHAT